MDLTSIWKIKLDVKNRFTDSPDGLNNGQTQSDGLTGRTDGRMDECARIHVSNLTETKNSERTERTFIYVFSSLLYVFPCLS